LPALAPVAAAVEELGGVGAEEAEREDEVAAAEDVEIEEEAAGLPCGDACHREPGEREPEAVPARPEPAGDDAHEPPAVREAERDEHRRELARHPVVEDRAEQELQSEECEGQRREGTSFANESHASKAPS